MHIRVRFDKAVDVSTGHFRRELHLDIDLIGNHIYEVNMKDNNGGHISFAMTCKGSSTLAIATAALNHIKGKA